MRKLPAVFVFSALFACATSSVQACSSGDGAADLGPQDGGNTADAAVDATVDATTSSSGATSSSSGEPPRNLKPTDGGIDLGNLEPGEYALTVNDCSPFTPCGGEVSGKDYTYAGGCFDEDGLEAAVRDVSGCAAIEVSNSRAVVKGTFDFDESTYDRNVRLRFSGDVLIPGSCSFLTLAGGCSGITQNAASFGFSGLVCYDPVSGTGCDCALNTEQEQITAGGYSVGGGEDGGPGTELVLTGQDGGAISAPYCVDGAGTMHHTQRAAKPSPADPGNYITWRLMEQPQ